MNTLPRMVRVSGERLCAVCGKSTWCLLSPDGKSAICQRVESRRKCGEAGYLHRLDEPIPAFIPPPERAIVRGDWHEPACRYAEALTGAKKRELALSLGLPEDGLSRLALLGLWQDNGQEAFTFPERDGHGKVIGLNRRFPTGQKLHLAGGQRGITLPEGWNDGSPVYVVEGPTDTMAMVCAGLTAWGRPSNIGGTEYLAEAIRQIDPETPVIVMGENDRKPDGLWPGLSGAVTVAGNLAERVRNPVKWALAPTDYKDVREYLTSERFSDTPWDRRGLILAGDLEIHDARTCPAGYREQVRELARQIGYDPARWRD